VNKIISRLLVYKDIPEDSILIRLAQIISEANMEGYDKDSLRNRVLVEINRLLKISTEYAFDENLWQNYLTYLIITNENPFALSCEKAKEPIGSVNIFAKGDFEVFMELFHYDFSDLEYKLQINCFSIITDYTAVKKPEVMYNKNVSIKVKELSRKLDKAKDVDEFFWLVTNFYMYYGVGMFGLNKAFRIKESTASDDFSFVPINNMDEVVLDDLVGYEIQKKKLVDNTKAFVAGKRANNVLCYGDSGTGKSTSIKAIVNEFYNDGLRMIEIYKHQFKYLSEIIARLKFRNYKFIIYMDDLSFEEFEIEYKFLKAVIEGGVETKPDNILIYATSNRRHIIKETWSDRDDVKIDNGIHQSDNMEEKLSLVNRFGVTICYTKPSNKEYMNIVLELAHKNGVNLSDEEIVLKANAWELSHGGLSGRTATQFVNYLLGQ